jgi:hypothetical protein
VRLSPQAIFGCLLLALWLGGGSRVDSAPRPLQPAEARDRVKIEPVIVIHGYEGGLSGVRAANAAVHLKVGRDPALSDETVLFVDYPAPTDDPAGRDVQCDAENQDWSAGRAISFRVRPEHALRLSVSFFDRNRVVYTTFTELKGGVWQVVRMPFDEMRPNPYFQPPDARTGAPIDVSDVRRIAFAPQDKTSGRLAIGRFVVSK